MKRDLALGAALTVSLLANVYLYVALKDERAMQPYFSSDQPLIDAAIADYAAETKGTPGEAMRMRFAVVARTGSGTCVNLMLRRGIIGVVPVYCYSRAGRLVHRARI